MTCLMWAAANNQLEAVLYLQENGADCHTTANQGENSLLLAAAYGHTQVVTVLLTAGMDINYACQVNYIIVSHY